MLINSGLSEDSKLRADYLKLFKGIAIIYGDRPFHCL